MSIFLIGNAIASEKNEAGIKSDLAASLKIDPETITVQALDSSTVTDKDGIYLIEILKKKKDDEHNKCKYIGKSLSERSYIKEVNNYTKLKEIVSQKLCSKDGSMPSTIKLGKFKGALENQLMTYFKAANGKPLSGIELTDEIIGDFGHQLALWHKTLSTGVKLTNENDLPEKRYFTVVHGDLNLTNIFYDEKNNVFTFIDYETMAPDSPVDRDIAILVTNLIKMDLTKQKTSGGHSSLFQSFEKAYLEVFQDSSDEIKNIIKLVFLSASKNNFSSKETDAEYAKYFDLVNGAGALEKATSSILRGAKNAVAPNLQYIKEAAMSHLQKGRLSADQKSFEVPKDSEAKGGSVDDTFVPVIGAIAGIINKEFNPRDFDCNKMQRIEEIYESVFESQPDLIKKIIRWSWISQIHYRLGDKCIPFSDIKALRDEIDAIAH